MTHPAICSVYYVLHDTESDTMQRRASTTAAETPWSAAIPPLAMFWKSARRLHPFSAVEAISRRSSFGMGHLHISHALGRFVPFSLLQALLGARSLLPSLFAFAFSYAFLSRIVVVCSILPPSLGAVVYPLQRATSIPASSPSPSKLVLDAPGGLCRAALPIFQEEVYIS